MTGAPTYPPSNAEEAEAFHDHCIQTARRIIADDLSTIRLRLRSLDEQQARLDDGGPGSGTLYDVEYADTGAAKIVRTALDQILVALTAIEAVVPKPDPS